MTHLRPTIGAGPSVVVTLIVVSVPLIPEVTWCVDDWAGNFIVEPTVCVDDWTGNFTVEPTVCVDDWVGNFTVEPIACVDDWVGNFTVETTVGPTVEAVA